MTGKDGQNYQGRHARPQATGQRLTKPLAIVAVLVVLAALAVGGVSVWPKASGFHRILHSLTSGSTKHQAAKQSGGVTPGNNDQNPGGQAPKGTAAAVGSAGVTASWVTAENAKPGTSDWIVPPRQTGAPIEGYADHVSATPGATVNVYVNTPAPQFHIEAYRLGYYGGAGGRLVWKSPEITGVPQGPCPVTPITNMVECNWTSPVSVPISSEWVQGDYFLDLVADPGQKNYVPLTVTNPTSHATYLIDNSVLTWEAWNMYGGHNILGSSPVDPRRSRVVSFDRPYADFQFLPLEYPLVKFAEQHGLDVTYTTDIDLDQNPDQVLSHKAVFSLGHSEFWTPAERQSFISAIGHGVNVTFFGATPGLRPARMQPSALGPTREMVAYRNSREDPVTATDPQASTPAMWSDPPLNDPPPDIIGDTYSGFTNGGTGSGVPMIVVDASAWPFAGTGLANGAQLPGVVFDDYDTWEPLVGEPTNIQILSDSPVTGALRKAQFATMSYYTSPSGAGVLATGTMGWISVLSGGCPKGTVGCATDQINAITANIFRVFGAGPAGQSHPSVPNANQFFPPSGAPGTP